MSVIAEPGHAPAVPVSWQLRARRAYEAALRDKALAAKEANADMARRLAVEIRTLLGTFDSAAVTFGRARSPETSAVVPTIEWDGVLFALWPTNLRDRQHLVVLHRCPECQATVFAAPVPSLAELGRQVQANITCFSDHHQWTTPPNA